MVVRQVAVGDVLRSNRRWIKVDASAEYVAIGVRAFGRGIFHYEPVPGSNLGRLRFFEVQPKSLIVSNIKAWEGAVDVSGFNEKGAIGSNRFLSYEPTDGQADVNFVRHYFLTEAGNQKLQRASPGSADRNRTLAASRFEDILVPLSSPPEQRRIAARLDRLAERSDDLSRSTQSGSSVLRLLPRILDRVWTSAQLPDTTVGELCQPINDLVRPGQDPSPAREFVGLEFLQPHTGLRLGAGPVTGLSGRKFRFQEGDVLYGYLRPYQNKVWGADRVGLCSVEQYVLRPGPLVDPTLLSAALRSSRVLDYAVSQTNSLQLPRLGIRALLTATVPDVRLTPPGLMSKLQSTTSDCVRAASLTERRNVLSTSLLPAARNEAFAKLT